MSGKQQLQSIYEMLDTIVWILSTSYVISIWLIWFPLGWIYTVVTDKTLHSIGITEYVMLIAWFALLIHKLTSIQKSSKEKEVLTGKFNEALQRQGFK